MRLATFNLLHGRSPHDGLVDATRLSTAVANLDADVLALQEVDRDQSRSNHLDLTSIAAHAMDAPDHRFAAAVVGTPGEGFRPLTHDDDGHGEPLYGIGLISRYPVRSWQVIRLTALPVRSPVIAPAPAAESSSSATNPESSSPPSSTPRTARSPPPPPTSPSYPAGTSDNSARSSGPYAPCPRPGSSSAT